MRDLGKRQDVRPFLGGMDGFGWKGTVVRAFSPLPDRARQHSCSIEIGGATLILPVNLSINPLFLARIYTVMRDPFHVLDICEPRYWRVVSLRFSFGFWGDSLFSLRSLD